MAQVSMNEESPYVAKEGAVGELGQPISQQGAPGSDQVSDRGLFGGHHKDSTTQVDPKYGGTKHPLEATQDVNIGHGQEPFEQQSPGEPKKHGVVGKIKDVLTGQKPGKGTATGAATAGSLVPGEEDYAGKTDLAGGHHSGWPQPVAPAGVSTGATGVPPATGHQGYNEKPSGYGEGAQHGYGQNPSGTYQSYDEKPQHGANLASSAVSGYGGNPQYGQDKPGYEAQPGYDGRSGAEGYGDKPQHGYSTQPGEGYGGYDKPGYGPEGYGGKQHQHGYDKPGYGAEGYGDKPQSGYSTQPGSGAEGYGGYDKPSYGAQGYGGKQQHGYDKPGYGAEGYGDKPYAEKPAYEQQSQGGYGGAGAGEGKYGRPEENLTSSAGAAAGQDKYTSSMGSTPQNQVPISTPAEPEARHDVPSTTNAPAAEYTDPHGNVHPEGPRDDNVKKEGLMSKLMDKLHISGKKHKKHGDEATTL